MKKYNVCLITTLLGRYCSKGTSVFETGYAGPCDIAIVSTVPFRTDTLPLTYTARAVEAEEKASSALLSLESSDSRHLMRLPQTDHRHTHETESASPSKTVKRSGCIAWRTRATRLSAHGPWARLDWDHQPAALTQAVAAIHPSPSPPPTSKLFSTTRRA
jgi:hypothetical protein